MKNFVVMTLCCAFALIVSSELTFAGGGGGGKNQTKSRISFTNIEPVGAMDMQFGYVL